MRTPDSRDAPSVGPCLPRSSAAWRILHVPVGLAFLPRVTPNLGTEGARAYSELLLERAAEMGRFAESPTESNIGDGAFTQPGS